MTDATRNDATPGSSEPAPAPPLPYEPPRLVQLGDLKNLLGKSGTKFDNPQPHLKRV